MSFYGCALWSLDSRAIRYLDVCLNNCLRRIWSLPRNSHTNILHSVSGCTSVFNICYKRFCSMFHSACSSSNLLVCNVFQSASLSCRNFIGFNFKFGKDFLRDYSDVCLDSVGMIREIRDRSLYIFGFDPSELNCIVRALVT